MANSLKKQTQGDAMNLPPGIDRLTLKDGTPRYRVRIRISDHKPISKSFKNLTHAKQWKRITEGQIEKGLYVSFSKADQHTVSQAIIRYLSREELARLAEACKKSQNSDLYLIFLIALTTGARKSEILWLKGSDVDLENRLFLLSDTKNSESRTLPISEQVFGLIKGRPMTRDGFLFPSPENFRL